MTQPIDPATPPDGYTQEDIARQHTSSDGGDKRPRFARDHDRLIHAPALRRLQGKTQVVTPGEADFFRTRLTHSLEVAQVARHLAQKLGADRDLCESAALLHDLGHPPFAHIGEETLNDELDKIARALGLDPSTEVGGFNGNAQSFRLAVKSLSHKTGFRGLDLTRGVLDGAIKYPWQRDEAAAPESDERWCFFPTDSKEAEWVRTGVPQARQFTKSFEAQIVEWADDIAYSIHDVEDWYRAGFMPLEMIVSSDHTLHEFAKSIAPKVGRDDFTDTEARDEVVEFFRSPGFKSIRSHYDGSGDAKEGIRVMRRFLFDEFTQVTIADEKQPPTRHHNDLVIDPLAKLHSRVLKQLLTRYVLSHPRMATYEVGQARVIRGLMSQFVGALGFNPETSTFDKKEKLGIFPADMQDALRTTADDTPERLRLIADQIAGMTDGYAIRLHARLTGVGIGSFNEFV